MHVRGKQYAILLGKRVDPKEIAGVSLFLVSGLAASIAGAEILMDTDSTPGVQAETSYSHNILASHLTNERCGQADKHRSNENDC